MPPNPKTTKQAAICKFVDSEQRELTLGFRVEYKVSRPTQKIPGLDYLKENSPALIKKRLPTVNALSFGHFWRQCSVRRAITFNDKINEAKLLFRVLHPIFITFFHQISAQHLYQTFHNSYAFLILVCICQQMRSLFTTRPDNTCSLKT